MAFTQVDALDRLPPLTPQQDALVQPLLDTALALAETYCNRKFMLDDETETLIPVYGGTLSLRRYPLVSVDSITGVHADNTADVTPYTPTWVIGGTPTSPAAGGTLVPTYSINSFHIDKPAGLVRLERIWASHEVTVSYRGGYDVLPDDLLLALWLVFDALWSMTPGAGLAVGGTGGSLDGLRSLEIPDVGKLVFADAGSGAGSSKGGAMGGAIPLVAAGILSLYRREIV